MQDKLNIIIAESAAKEIRKMDPEARRRILSKLSEYQDKPDLVKVDIKQLEDTHDPILYRFRIGDYRLIINIEGNSLQVLHVLHRSKAY